MTSPRKLLVLAALVLAGCAGIATPAPTPSVPWADYAPTVRSRIDLLALAKDCTGLQGEFDGADAGNQATLARTGHNNAALMAYIDEQLRRVGCYR